MMFFVDAGVAVRLADRRTRDAGRDYLWAGARGRRGDRIQVLRRVHPRRRSRWRISLTPATSPRRRGDVRGWLAWTAARIEPARGRALVFAIVNPMAFIYSREVPSGHPGTDRQSRSDRRRSSRSGSRSSPMSSRSCTGSRPTCGGDWVRRSNCGDCSASRGCSGAGLARDDVAAAFPLIYLAHRRRARSRRWRGTRCRLRRRSPSRPAPLSEFLLDRPRWRNGCHGRDRRRGRAPRLCTRWPT